MGFPNQSDWKAAWKDGGKPKMNNACTVLLNGVLPTRHCVDSFDNKSVQQLPADYRGTGGALCDDTLRSWRSASSLKPSLSPTLLRSLSIHITRILRFNWLPTHQPEEPEDRLKSSRRNRVWTLIQINKDNNSSNNNSNNDNSSNKKKMNILQEYCWWAIAVCPPTEFSTRRKRTRQRERERARAGISLYVYKLYVCLYIVFIQVMMVPFSFSSIVVPLLSQPRVYRPGCVSLSVCLERIVNVIACFRNFVIIVLGLDQLVKNWVVNDSVDDFGF